MKTSSSTHTQLNKGANHFKFFFSITCTTAIYWETNQTMCSMSILLELHEQQSYICLFSWVCCCPGSSLHFSFPLLLLVTALHSFEPQRSYFYAYCLLSLYYLISIYIALQKIHFFCARVLIALPLSMFLGHIFCSRKKLACRRANSAFG